MLGPVFRVPSSFLASLQFRLTTVPTLHVFDFLSGPSTEALPGYVLFGDEPFLRQLALQKIKKQLIPDEDDPVTRFDGDRVEWRDVADELSTVSLFGSDHRVAVVEDADSFVSQHRDRLENYFEHPSTTGTLILLVETWLSTTRLYKRLDKIGLQIDCSPPTRMRGRTKTLDEAALCKWLVKWAQQRHQIELQTLSVQLLVELVGPHLGLLDQELAKLALFAGKDAKVTAELVKDVVGGWRAKTAWEMIDAAVGGQGAEALRQFDRLLQSGEEPIALFGQISWSLRRYAAATRIFEQSERSGKRIELREALQQAGIRDWPDGELARCEQRLKTLGRERAGKIFRWLMEADLALKGSHSTPHRARWILEQLILRLDQHVAPKKKPARA